MESPTNTYSCPKCNSVGYIKDMPIKMGGLLCQGCRRIIFAPYVDPEYFIERNRRNAEYEKEKQDELNRKTT